MGDASPAVNDMTPSAYGQVIMAGSAPPPRVAGVALLVLILLVASTAIQAGTSPSRPITHPSLQAMNSAAASSGSLTMVGLGHAKQSVHLPGTAGNQEFQRHSAAGLGSDLRPTPASFSVSSVNAGRHPFSATYDSGNGYVYVTNQYSANVTVISGSAIVGSVSVGDNPAFSAYDSGNGYVYVPNGNSSSVSVISGTAVVATIPVGSTPSFPIYDSGNGFVYVTSSVPDTVSVINGTSVVATIRVGSYPFAGAYDSGNGYVYVANAYAGNVSVLNGTKLVAAIPVGPSPSAASR
ncbi:MAG: YncE family protein [Thermoplasmata archaeon]|nr:YncE family protein [Thermoplasmata archaeon]